MQETRPQWKALLSSASLSFEQHSQATENGLKSAKAIFVTSLCSRSFEERFSASDLLQQHILSGDEKRKNLAKDVMAEVSASKDLYGAERIRILTNRSDVRSELLRTEET